jgi:hypothetical protein
LATSETEAILAIKHITGAGIVIPDRPSSEIQLEPLSRLLAAGAVAGRRYDRLPRQFDGNVLAAALRNLDPFLLHAGILRYYDSQELDRTVL